MESKQYRKKPIIVEAVQWTGFNIVDITDFAKDAVIFDIYDAAWKAGVMPPVALLSIKTLEGIMVANINDYIIKGVNGEFYPCKPDIFNKTYEKI